MYTQEQFLEEVAKEAEAIKQKATKREIDRLSFRRLCPAKTDTCIYGMMTGDCYSQRAAELIIACTPRYFQYPVMPASWEYEADKISFKRISENANGEEVVGFLADRMSRIFTVNYSALEVYILWKEAKNENLIAYLRDEIDTLIL